MIYIVIPVFNRLEYTIKCIESLCAQSYKEYKILVVNHGSTDGTQEYLVSNYPEVVLIRGTPDLWWTGAVNLGINKALELSKSTDDFILTLNNDLIVQDNYLEELIALSKIKKRIIIGSTAVDIANPLKIYYAGSKLNLKTAKYKANKEISVPYNVLSKQQEYLATDILPGRGVLIPILVFNEIGLYDVKYFPHYMADEDFSLRAKRESYELVVSIKAVVYNYVEQTGIKDQKRDLRYFMNFFTSIKSPANLKYRWRWASRHSETTPVLYFAIDTLRVIKSLIF